VWAAEQTKDENRAALTAELSPLVRPLQASAQGSNAEEAALGISADGGKTTEFACPSSCRAELAWIRGLAC
jgi:hypothetical protein